MEWPSWYAALDSGPAPRLNPRGCEASVAPKMPADGCLSAAPTNAEILALVPQTLGMSVAQRLGLSRSILTVAPSRCSSAMSPSVHEKVLEPSPAPRMSRRQEGAASGERGGAPQRGT